MNLHTIFYYPYGSFQDEQAPLLKAAALYFDNLHILDPLKASGGHIGAAEVAKDVDLLEQQGILVRISPEEVLEKYEAAIAAAIRADLEDAEFLQLCETSGRAQAWRLALAKVPKEIRENPKHKQFKKREPQDQAMQRLMGELPRQLAGQVTKYSETYQEATQQLYSEQFVLDEMWSGAGGKALEYRFADYPLPLGESIMINHALFAGLLYAKATPITDDPFHNQVLNLKIKRALKIPQVRQIWEDRAQQQKLKQNILAMSAITDKEIDLPALSPQLPLKKILKYREKHGDELEQVRKHLGSLARKIRVTPWSEEFAAELYHDTVPSIMKDLEECKKARDAWLKNAVKGTGLAVGAAAATISLVFSPTPLLPVAVVTGILELVSGTVIPGFEFVLDWKEGKQKAAENGLHYLLKLK